MLAPLHATGETLSDVSLGVLQLGEGGVRRSVDGPWWRAARGRWMRLCLRMPASASAVDFVLAGRPDCWPDARGGASCDTDGTAQVWVYVGQHASQLYLYGAAMADAICVRAEVFDAPPPSAEVAVSMRTAHVLEQLGVRSVRQVHFSGDARWPLMAIGDDPQLYFAPLAAGRWQVSLTLHVEHSGASPIAYWADASRPFTPQSCAHFQSNPLEGDGRWYLVLPRLRDGARWRLDPRDAPGRFRLDDVQWQRLDAAATAPPGWFRSAAAWLHGLRPRRGVDDLVPVGDLRCLDSRRRCWASTGHDPHFRLATPLAAGWYMVEVEVTLPVALVHGRLYLDTGAGEAEVDAHGLPLRSGRLAKRLLWVPRRAHLRFDPLTAPGEFELRHFRVQRVLASFAAQRMLTKLSTAGWSRAASSAAGDAWALWPAYRQLFERRDDIANHYGDWIANVEQPALLSPTEQVATIASWVWCPLVSIVTPVFDPPVPLLRECLDSVLAQTYPHWQLCVADDASTNPAVRATLAEYAGRDGRIRVVCRETNGHIASASNSALALADGEFVALLDHDDTLAPHALFAVVQALQRRPTAQIVYSDEDKLDPQGHRCDPFFKPDWSPDLLRGQNYVCHLSVIRRALVQSVGGFRPGFEGSQDYDLLLRCSLGVEDPRDIVHVPQVLYHWRQTAGSTAAGHAHKDYAVQAAVRALQEHVDTLQPGISVSVTAPGLYRCRWPLPDPPPLVTLIVPTRDALDVVRVCVESIVGRTTYPSYEIVVVDNQSSDPATLAWLEGAPKQYGGRVSVLRHNAPFNFAAINNRAVLDARGSVVGLINNDIEVINADWLAEMVSHVMRPDIGCVGAKLYYPDGTLQHAGVVLGIGGVAGHSHKYYPGQADGYFGRLRVVHEVSAVTGAALLVRKAVYQQVGGMDEAHLAVAFNDVDFCLKVRDAGYRNLFTPFAELVHHESKTRGTDQTPEKRQRFQGEVDVMLRRWGSALTSDPYYNRNLSLVREDYSLALHLSDAPATVFAPT